MCLERCTHNGVLVFLQNLTDKRYVDVLKGDTVQLKFGRTKWTLSRQWHILPHHIQHKNHANVAGGLSAHHLTKIRCRFGAHLAGSSFTWGTSEYLAVEQQRFELSLKSKAQIHVVIVVKGIFAGHKRTTGDKIFGLRCYGYIF